MKLEHRQNLADLADWLEAHVNPVDEHTLRIGGHVGIFDMSKYADGYDFDYKPACGSTGCAIGWATWAIEPRNTNARMSGGRYLYETWEVYSVRLFGHSIDDTIGAFMFGGNWDNWPSQSTPQATAQRIRAVLYKGGKIPDSWPRWDYYEGAVEELPHD